MRKLQNNQLWLGTALTNTNIYIISVDTTYPKRGGTVIYLRNMIKEKSYYDTLANYISVNKFVKNRFKVNDLVTINNEIGQITEISTTPYRLTHPFNICVGTKFIITSHLNFELVYTN